ncbi:MAG: DsbA family oxidoreductase [Pseudomonadota bacterium]
MSNPQPRIVHAGGPQTVASALHIEVIADLVCPFCFIGKRRLDEALNAVGGPRNITWHPYQLNPEMPAEGMSLEAYLASRFGKADDVQPVLDRIADEGASAAIDFRFDNIKHVPNTVPAHQVMHLAQNEGVDQTVLAEDLMHAYFERGKDIGDREVLIEAAIRHGLSPVDVVRAIEDQKIREIVLSREAQVRASGMAGIPGFLLNRRLLVVGAQDTDTLIGAFDQAMFGDADTEVETPALH